MTVQHAPTRPDDVELGPHGLTDQQYRQLLKAINDARVLTLDGKDYLATWDVEAHLTRIFGFGGWDDDTLWPPTLIFEDSRARYYKKGDKKGKPVVDEHGDQVLGWWAAYRVTVRLTVRNIRGEVIASHCGDATGSADNQPDRAAAHDLAIKSAASGALKRAAIKLGDQFGLSLYANTRQAVVGRTLVWSDPEAPGAGEGHTDADGVAVTELGEDDAGLPSVDPDTGEVLDDAGGGQDPRPDPAAAARTKPQSARQPASSGAAGPGDGVVGNGAAAAALPARGDPAWRQPPRTLVRRFSALARQAGVDDAGVGRFFQARYGVDGPGDLHAPALTKLLDHLAADGALEAFKTHVAGLDDAPSAPAGAGGERA